MQLGPRHVKDIPQFQDTLQIWCVGKIPHGNYMLYSLHHWNCLRWNGPLAMRNIVSNPGIFQMCVTTALLTDYGFWKFNRDIAYCTACRCRIVSPWIITKLMDYVPYYLPPAHWHCEWMACNTWYLITEIMTNVWNGFHSLGVIPQVTVLWHQLMDIWLADYRSTVVYSLATTVSGGKDAG